MSLDSKHTLLQIVKNLIIAETINFRSSGWNSLRIREISLHYFTSYGNKLLFFATKGKSRSLLIFEVFRNENEDWLINKISYPKEEYPWYIWRKIEQIRSLVKIIPNFDDWLVKNSLTVSKENDLYKASGFFSNTIDSIFVGKGFSIEDAYLSAWINFFRSTEILSSLSLAQIDEINQRTRQE